VIGRYPVPKPRHEPIPNAPHPVCVCAHARINAHTVCCMHYVLQDIWIWHFTLGHNRWNRFLVVFDFGLQTLYTISKSVSMKASPFSGKFHTLTTPSQPPVAMTAWETKRASEHVSLCAPHKRGLGLQQLNTSCRTTTKKKRPGSYCCR
jgi:hypothetical protein